MGIEYACMYLKTSIAGGRSAIRYEFLIARRLSSYFWQVYVPSLFLSIFGAISVFIPSDVANARMGLSMTSFLALISLFGSAR